MFKKKLTNRLKNKIIRNLDCVKRFYHLQIAFNDKSQLDYQFLAFKRPKRRRL